MDISHHISLFWGQLAGPTGYRIALALIHFLWQGVAIALLAGLFMRLLGRRSSQRRYAIGLAGLLAMAIAPVVTFFLITPPAAPPESLDITPAATESFDPAAIPPGEFTAEIARLDALIQSLETELRETAANPVTVPEQSASWSDILRRWQPYLLLLWLVGVTVYSLRLAAGAQASWRYRLGRKPLPESARDALLRVAKRLGVKAPRVFVSERVMEAVAVGLFRPFILLPAAWIGRIPPEMLEAVLAHEIAHLRRYDLWINLAQRCLETLLFYHPALWWLSRRVRQEREYCCDEIAAGTLETRAAYARALEFVAAERLLASRLATLDTALVASIGGKEMALLNRVRRVLGNDPLPGRFRWRWATGAALLLPVCLWGMFLWADGLAWAGGDGEGAVRADRPEVQESPHELPWQPFSTARVNSLISLDKTVLVNFTAEWSVSGRMNESAALNTKETKAFVTEHDVVPVLADFTNESPAIQKWLDSFNAVGIPLTVIFPAANADEPIVLKGIYSQETLLAHLKNAVGTEVAKGTTLDGFQPTASEVPVIEAAEDGSHVSEEVGFEPGSKLDLEVLEKAKLGSALDDLLDMHAQLNAIGKAENSNDPNVARFRLKALAHLAMLETMVQNRTEFRHRLADRWTEFQQFKQDKGSEHPDVKEREDWFQEMRMKLLHLRAIEAVLPSVSELAHAESAPDDVPVAAQSETTGTTEKPKPEESEDGFTPREEANPFATLSEAKKQERGEKDRKLKELQQENAELQEQIQARRKEHEQPAPQQGAKNDEEARTRAAADDDEEPANAPNFGPPLSAREIKDAQMMQLGKLKSTLQAELAYIRQDKGPQHPDVKSLETRISTLQEMLNDYWRTGSKSRPPVAPTNATEPDRETADSSSHSIELPKTEEMIRDNIRDLKQKLADLPEDDPRHQELLDEIRVLAQRLLPPVALPKPTEEASPPDPEIYALRQQYEQALKQQLETLKEQKKDTEKEVDQLIERGVLSKVDLRRERLEMNQQIVEILGKLLELKRGETPAVEGVSPPTIDPPKEVLQMFEAKQKEPHGPLTAEAQPVDSPANLQRLQRVEFRIGIDQKTGQATVTFYDPERELKITVKTDPDKLPDLLKRLSKRTRGEGNPLPATFEDDPFGTGPHPSPESEPAAPNSPDSFSE